MKKFDSFCNDKKNDNDYMKIAIKEGELSKSNGDKAVGAVLMMSDGKIIRDCDTSYSEQNFINHAMINVINKSKILSKGKPEIIWTTKEPCLMCIMAAYYNGIREVVFGAYDEAAGFMSAKLLVDHSFLGISYRGGVLGKECAELLPESYQEHLKI